MYKETFAMWISEKFRNIKIQEDEIKPELDGEPELEPEDDMNSIYDHPRKPSENPSISTSGSASIYLQRQVNRPTQLIQYQQVPTVPQIPTFVRNVWL